MKKLLKITFLITLIILWWLFFNYHNLLNNKQNTANLNLNIPTNSSSSQILDILQEENIIKSDLESFLAKVYLKKNNLAPNLKAGDFYFSENLNLKQLIEQLQQSPTPQQIIITIPEGKTVAQIDQLIANKFSQYDSGDLNDFLQNEHLDLPLNEYKLFDNWEGFLFPDTYFFAPNDSLTKITTKMIKNLEKKLQQNDFTDYSKLSDIIIVASLIERETRTSAERPIVAGIIWKRLENQVPLGIDATTRYYLNDWQNPITYEQLQDDNAYNTRKNLGLPPTPIGNPGLNSILAAINPQESEYWYYLHDSQGQIHYGKNLDEHNLNVQRYLR